MPTPRFIPLADLHEDPANVRKHGDRNKASVRASILEFGQVETLVVQRGTGRVLGGNCRLGELRALGREGAWCMEVDVEGIDATRLALALNRTAELAEWDADALGRLLSDLAPEDLGDLWTTEEVGALCKEVEGALGGDDAVAAGLDDTYTRKIKAPVYEPKGQRPPVGDLFDRTKTASLIAQIDDAGLPDELASFLRLAAERHTVFNFHRIAEFYCHAPAAVQDLMERSGLVIIDFDKAIEYGFVHLTERLGALADLEGFNET